MTDILNFTTFEKYNKWTAQYKRYISTLCEYFLTVCRLKKSIDKDIVHFFTSVFSVITINPCETGIDKLSIYFTIDFFEQKLDYINSEIYTLVHEPGDVRDDTEHSDDTFKSALKILQTFSVMYRPLEPAKTKNNAFDTRQAAGFADEDTAEEPFNVSIISLDAEDTTGPKQNSAITDHNEKQLDNIQTALTWGGDQTTAPVVESKKLPFYASKTLLDLKNKLIGDQTTAPVVESRKKTLPAQKLLFELKNYVDGVKNKSLDVTNNFRLNINATPFSNKFNNFDATNHFLCFFLYAIGVNDTCDLNKKFENGTTTEEKQLITLLNALYVIDLHTVRKGYLECTENMVNMASISEKFVNSLIDVILQFKVITQYLLTGCVSTLPKKPEDIDGYFRMIETSIFPVVFLENGYVYGKNAIIQEPVVYNNRKSFEFALSESFFGSFGSLMLSWAAVLFVAEHIWGGLGDDISEFVQNIAWVLTAIPGTVMLINFTESKTTKTQVVGNFLNQINHFSSHIISELSDSLLPKQLYIQYTEITKNGFIPKSQKAMMICQSTISGIHIGVSLIGMLLYNSGDSGHMMKLVSECVFLLIADKISKKIMRMLVGIFDVNTADTFSYDTEKVGFFTTLVNRLQVFNPFNPQSNWGYKLQVYILPFITQFAFMWLFEIGTTLPLALETALVTTDPNAAFNMSQNVTIQSMFAYGYSVVSVNGLYHWLRGRSIKQFAGGNPFVIGVGAIARLMLAMANISDTVGRLYDVVSHIFVMIYDVVAPATNSFLTYTGYYNDIMYPLLKNPVVDIGYIKANSDDLVVAVNTLGENLPMINGFTNDQKWIDFNDFGKNHMIFLFKDPLKNWTIYNSTTLELMNGIYKFVNTSTPLSNNTDAINAKTEILKLIPKLIEPLDTIQNYKNALTTPDFYHNNKVDTIIGETDLKDQISKDALIQIINKMKDNGNKTLDFLIKKTEMPAFKTDQEADAYKQVLCLYFLRDEEITDVLYNSKPITDHIRNAMINNLIEFKGWEPFKQSFDTMVKQWINDFTSLTGGELSKDIQNNLKSYIVHFHFGVKPKDISAYAVVEKEIIRIKHPVYAFLTPYGRFFEFDQIVPATKDLTNTFYGIGFFTAAKVAFNVITWGASVGASVFRTFQTKGEEEKYYKKLEKRRTKRTARDVNVLITLEFSSDYIIDAIFFQPLFQRALDFFFNVHMKKENYIRKANETHPLYIFFVKMLQEMTTSEKSLEDVELGEIVREVFDYCYIPGDPYFSRYTNPFETYVCVCVENMDDSGTELVYEEIHNNPTENDPDREILKIFKWIFQIYIESILLGQFKKKK